jgi:hypothetical protein
MTNPVILFRDTGDWKYESNAAVEHFKVINSRMKVESGNLIISRYSCLPFYKELETDVEFNEAKLINSFRQHRYIADLFNWYSDLEELTPKTWFRLEEIPDEGPFVLKGETNSKKFLWSSMMFAQDKRTAIEVHSRLCADSMIGDQKIYIRKYEPLVQFMTGLQGLPITREFRFFVAYGQILSGGFYWSNYADQIDAKDMDVNQVPKDFLQKIIDRIGKNCNFYVIDVAQTQSGEWIVIELNDGQMSGLSENNPDILYKNLRKVIDER